MSKIRIVSDGTTAGTSILGPNGLMLPCVSSVTVVADVNGSGVVRALVQFDDVALDMIATLEDAP